jgi:hypothetical protein
VRTQGRWGRRTDSGKLLERALGLDAEEGRSADYPLASVPGQAADVHAATSAIAQSREGDSTMLANAFIGTLEKPTEEELAATLGPTKVIWDRLVTDLACDHGVDVQEWSSYSPKAGWSLRLKRKKRTIVWLSPCRGCFRVMFILGDRAMEAARRSKLPQRVVRILDEAPRYPEGTGIRMNVKGQRDVGIVEKLAVIKLEN